MQNRRLRRGFQEGILHRTIGFLKQVNFAIVGCGKIIRKHVHALRHLSAEEAKLVAVCDISAVRADSIHAAVPGLGSYTNFARMLRRTARYRHREYSHAHEGATCQEQGAGRASPRIVGKHVVIEKPISLRIESWRTGLATTTAAAGRRVFVVKQNRFNPAVSRTPAKSSITGPKTSGSAESLGTDSRPLAALTRVYYDADPMARDPAREDGRRAWQIRLSSITCASSAVVHGLPVEMRIRGACATRLVDTAKSKTLRVTVRPHALLKRRTTAIIEATT